MLQVQPVTETAPGDRGAAEVPEGGPRGNDEFDWDRFGSNEYHEHNYARLREDDAMIIDLVRDWFAASADPQAGPRAGLDVGAGPNLYPALSMLPYCDRLTLREYSAANVLWLKEQTRDLAESWAPFWDRLVPSVPAPTFEQARTMLAERSTVDQGSIFDLPERTWGMGTMFFVAESLTEDPREFRRAVARFVGALTPGAPFAAAFMEMSQGYDVGGRRFPALAIDEAGIGDVLSELCRTVATHRIALPATPVRGGYEGMVVALGSAR